jgi:hypothetical protein
MFQQLDIAIAFVVVMLLLSLLVTAIVQAISAVFDLRGKNLVRALADLLKQIDSGLNAPDVAQSWQQKVRSRLAHPFTRITLATKIADAVTKHPLLAHTFTRAKSIRKDELFDVLMDLSSDNTIATIDPGAKAKLKQMLARQAPGGVVTVDMAQKIAAELGNKLPGLKDQLGQILTETMSSLSRVEAGIGRWFDSVMDRASDVFTRWTRTITIITSVLLVVILQIDAGLILKQVSTDPGVRAGLLKLSDTALTQADETLKSGNRGTAALQVVAEKHANDPAAADLKNAPSMGTCFQADQWLVDYQRNHPRTDFRDELKTRCEELTIAELKNTAPQIGEMWNELTATNLRIVPDKINGASVFGDEKAPFRERFQSWLRAYNAGWHLLGTLAMVVLLSLGAPFWFNTLKQLSNLKPSVTQKIEKESAAP